MSDLESQAEKHHDLEPAGPFATTCHMDVKAKMTVDERQRTVDGFRSISVMVSIL
jgi:hypothetical protein